MNEQQLELDQEQEQWEDDGGATPPVDLPWWAGPGYQ